MRLLQARNSGYHEELANPPRVNSSPGQLHLAGGSVIKVYSPNGVSGRPIVGDETAYTLSQPGLAVSVDSDVRIGDGCGLTVGYRALGIELTNPLLFQPPIEDSFDLYIT